MSMTYILWPEMPTKCSKQLLSAMKPKTRTVEAKDDKPSLFTPDKDVFCIRKQMAKS
jgi:hypothetical protein